METFKLIVIMIALAAVFSIYAYILNYHPVLGAIITIIGLVPTTISISREIHKNKD